MRYIYTPDYYQNFTCIADKCTHNCCIGWEIDIDEETMEKYRAYIGVLSERLKKDINTEGDTPCFILTEDERCPFLNEDNLCDIITHMGEESLCQICTDHPRFRNLFTYREELGIGLSCEEAARIILTDKEKFSLICDDDNAKEDFILDEIEFIVRRNDMFDILTDRDYSLTDRIKALLKYNMLREENIYIPCIKNVLLSFEILDKGWKEYISLAGELNEDSLIFPEGYEIPFEQLIIYFLYRHLAGSLDDGLFYERIVFSVVSTMVINNMTKNMMREKENFTFDDFVEICRMYSQEIEYSEDNTYDFIDEIGICL